ncbi:hypothetical protein V500_07935 [Pseudogymnoascus sp. VKM F-4518 (FW-2643)]|nr:hypothetical protein V500_07935 [Pseudogymnoascus sp. VKM F-4518 (FW-2643)]
MATAVIPNTIDPEKWCGVRAEKSGGGVCFSPLFVFPEAVVVTELELRDTQNNRKPSSGTTSKRWILKALYLERGNEV